MPESAPGSAIRMMNGSSQDWKFTTITKYTSKIANTSAITTQVNAILGGIAGKARIVARDIGGPIVAAAESGGGK